MDGRPVHPGDQWYIDQYAEWLGCSAEERRDPKWHPFLGIPPKMQELRDHPAGACTGRTAIARFRRQACGIR